MVRLSGHCPCYLCHSFSWVTSLLVSQPPPESFPWNPVSCDLQSVYAFHTAPTAIPFLASLVPPLLELKWFCSGWCMQLMAKEMLQNSPKTAVPCETGGRTGGTGPAQSEKSHLKAERRWPDLAHANRTGLSLEKKGILTNSSLSVQHWLHVLLCTHNSQTGSADSKDTVFQMHAKCIWIWLNHSFGIYGFVSNGTGLSTMWTINILCSSPSRVKWHKNLYL